MDRKETFMYLFVVQSVHVKVTNQSFDTILGTSLIQPYERNIVPEIRNNQFSVDYL
jgi:hypothetical protein